MKIGILTFHRPSNFGANLQAYASYCILNSLGHEVRVIDYVRQKDIDYSKTVPSVQFKAHKAFVESRLPLTRIITSQSELKNVITEENFDAIVIGADAVWRSPKEDDVFFGNWKLNDNNIAALKLAAISPAHMGTGFSDITTEHKELLRDCLNQFTFITVRDEWTKQVLNRDLFGGEDFIQIVNPDPVIMLSEFTKGEDWSCYGIKNKNFYLMTLPKNWCTGRGSKRKIKWFNHFKVLVNKSGYKLVELPLPEGKSGMTFDFTIDQPIDPMQWFLWIKNAKAFLGLRFHAIVSSISNETPFFSIDTYGDNSRTSAILDLIGLHSIARNRDKRSKIYQLLSGSGLESFRTGSHIELESPKRIFNKLESLDQTFLKKVKEQKIYLFKNNLSNLLDALSK